MSSNKLSPSANYIKSRVKLYHFNFYGLKNIKIEIPKKDVHLEFFFFFFFFVVVVVQSLYMKFFKEVYPYDLKSEIFNKNVKKEKKMSLDICKNKK